MQSSSRRPGVLGVRQRQESKGGTAQGVQPDSRATEPTLLSTKGEEIKEVKPQRPRSLTDRVKYRGQEVTIIGRTLELRPRYDIRYDNGKVLANVPGEKLHDAG